MRKVEKVQEANVLKCFFLKGFLTFLILLFTLGTLFAQSKSDLEKKKAQLRNEIEVANKILEDTRRNKNVSLNQLIALNKKISSRTELIQTIQREIRLLQAQIDQTTDGINSLESDLKILKEEYAKIIYFAYKNKNASQRIMFLFSAKDFNQAYKRLRYLQQYSEYRKTQKELIEKTQKNLSDKRADLELKKNDKTTLLSSMESEKQHLSLEKSEQTNVVNGLQKKEKELKAQLAEKQKAEARLNKAIEDIIRKEIEAARKKAAKEGKAPVKEGFALTPEAQKLSDDFASNKGKLPWPVEQGVITETFGVHPHPVLKGIETNNNGIDIGTNQGAVVRALFDGEVSGIIVIPGAGKAVLLRHGEYLSVYSNLADVMVHSGQKILTKQSLGTVLTRDEDSKTEMNLQIWKSTVKMNPETWLYKNSR